MAGKLSILFYADLAVPFAPSDLHDRPLGGSETALAYVARGLAALGHTVLVAAHPGERAGIYDRVRYANVESTDWRSVDPDITVVFRQLPHVRRTLPGRHRLLWAHDHIGVYPELAGFRRVILGAAWSFGHGLFGRYSPTIVAVSNWLRRCFTQFARWPEDAVRAIPNGIDPSIFTPSPLPSPPRPPRLAYTSVPERGLKVLLQRIMPAIWRKTSNAELHVFSYQTLDEYRRLAPAESDRVRFRGGVQKSALARELSDCDLWVYPTDFPETSCIAAMEAQAAGVPAISSRKYALPETIRHGETGLLIEGQVGSEAYIAGFAAAVIDLLSHSDRRLTLGQRARQRMLSEFTWEKAIRKWDELLQLIVTRDS